MYTSIMSEYMWHKLLSANFYNYEIDSSQLVLFQLKGNKYSSVK